MYVYVYIYIGLNKLLTVTINQYYASKYTNQVAYPAPHLYCAYQTHKSSCPHVCLLNQQSWSLGQV